MSRSKEMVSLSAAAGSMFADLGLPSFALARFFRRGGEPEVTVLDGTFHKEWSERYLANGYVSYSQSWVIRCSEHMRRSSHPITPARAAASWPRLRARLPH
jgi:hypothetical protein